jgi:uncharacterized protein YndB with AHSA1/START domain
MVEAVSRTVTVTAPPEEIFELLARSDRHHELDGSGSVQGPLGRGKRLELGSRFGMRMRVSVPYRIVNTVVEFDEGRRIAWRHFYRHVWRWELEPVEGGTRVTETFDWSGALSKTFLRWIGAPERNTRSIEATLERVAERFGPLEEQTAG